MSREAELEKEGISLLGNQNVKYPDQYAPEILETFLNKHPGNDYFVKFNCPEFTSLCPMTGQPDFATIYISYVPGERMVEIDPYCNYGKPGTRWEAVAWQRLSQHDIYPEKVDNR